MSIHIYKNNPNAGATDGQQVSEGDGSNPIVVGPLNAGNNEESAVITLAIRCEPGLTTSGDTILTLTGDNADKWALGVYETSFRNYGESLALPSGIADVNTLFYVKARAVTGETPRNDTSVGLQVNALIVGA